MRNLLWMPSKLRGRPVQLKRWWLEAARAKADGVSLEKLAADLSKAVHRKPPWDRTTVGKFLKNEFPTQELVDAFCKLFDLPPMIFVARSYAEADHFRHEARRYDNPDKASRKGALDEELARLEENVDDQTARVSSEDEQGDWGRRRPRGVVRGRSSPS
jgi:hypothetical protein